jgi:hypothetical protein
MRRCLAALFLLALPGVLSTQDTSIESLKQRVVELGQLEFRREVPVRYLRRAELKRYLDGLFANDYPAALSARESDYLWLMGFTPTRLDLRPLRRQVVLENAGGLYNEKTKELLALEEYRSLDMINALALVHELRHAVQDQHVGLGRMLGDRSDFDDRRLAMLSAVEGDATLIMIRQMGLDPETVAAFFNPETVLSFSNPGGGQALSRAPDIVRYQLLFPYLDGLRFSAAVFGKGGQKRLNRVLSEPPLSSAQILHPQFYLDGRAPGPVEIRFRPAGWEKYHDGVVGEYYLNVLLKTGGEVTDTAAGWAGDRFELWRRGDRRLLQFKSSWETAGDCERFFTELKRFLERRFGFEFKPGSESGREFLAGQSDAGYFFLSRSGDTIFYLRSDDRKLTNDFIGGGNYD